MTSPLATAFVLIRPTTTGFGPTLKRELDGAAGVAGASGKKTGESWTKGFQSSGVTKAANKITEGLVAAGVASVVMAVKFQSAMEKVHTQAGVAQKNIKGLGDGVLKLAGQVGFSPDSLAESLYHVESAFSSLGITGPKALKLVKIAAEGAAVGGADLVDTTNALTALEASGIKGAESMTKAMGIMNAIVGVGDMKMQDLADAFGTGILASIKGFGVTLRDAGAALAVFGDNNIRGAKAGQQLRMAVQALAKPTAAGAKELVSLGISSGSLAKAMQQGGLKLALETLAAKLKAAGVSTKETGQILTETFGKRAGVGIQILLSQMDRLESKYPALDKGASSFGDAWKKTQATASQQLKELGHGFEATGVQIGQKLLPPLMSLLGFVRNNTGLMLGLAAAIGTVAVAITAVSVAIRAWKAAQEIGKGLAFLFTNTAGLAATTVIAVGLLIYSLRNVEGGIESNIAAMAKQDKATGLNVAGYQKLSQSAGDASKSIAAVQSSTVMVGQAAGHAIALQQAYSDAQDKAAATARNLQQAFTVLGGEYSLNEGEVKTLIIKSGELKDVLAANGQITPQIADKIRKWAEAENAATGLTNAMSIAVNNLTNAIDKQAGKVLTLQGDELAWKSALQQANTQLASNTAGLKGNSANAIANKQSVLQATETVIGFAKQQLISGKNLGGASSAIQDQIQWLKGLKDHTGFTAAEIKILVGWLRQIKSEKVSISVTADGHWNILPSGKHIPVAAAGGMIAGGVRGKDSVPILAMPGEVVVPTNMVSSGAVDHLRGRLPGFAAGGVVGSYANGVKGLTPFLSHENLATLRAIEQATASAIFAAIRSGFGGVPGNVASYTPVVQRVLSMLGQPLADAGIVLSQIASESGGNPTIVNKWDSNWAAGTPSVGLMQVIGPTFAANAGSFRNTGPFEYGVSVNPLANIYAGMHYATGRYGADWVKVLGHGHGYDNGGWLPPGVSLAVNNTGRPEQVIPRGRGGAAPVVVLEVASTGSRFDRFMADWLHDAVRVKGGGDVQVAFGEP